MLNKVYSIKNCNLRIECDNLEVFKRLENWMSMFDETLNTAENYIKIQNNIISVSYKDISFSSKLVISDLYPLLMNILSNIINDDLNVFIHSTVISKNNKGILLLGDFGQGKTTLSLFAQEYGYIIDSADYSWLEIKQDKLYLKKGSLYIKNDNDGYLLQAYNSKVQIVKIAFLYGLCDNGQFSESLINNKQHLIKKLFPFVNWHSNLPLMFDEIELKSNNHFIKLFLAKIVEYDISFSIVRGDLLSVVNNFNNFLFNINDEYDLLFIKGLEHQDKELLKKIPKADCHVHGALGCKNFKNLYIFDRFDGYKEMKENINKFINPSIKNESDYFSFLYHTVMTAIDEGVSILEMSIDIRYYDYFHSLNSFLERLETLKDKRIILKFDIGISKSTKPDKFQIIFEMIKSHFFSGIDLYGDDSNEDFEKFLPVYKCAKKYHLKRKVHVGEFLNSSHISKALVLNPIDIQHGINIINEKNVNFNNLKFNVSLSSNYKLGSIKELSLHPIFEMYNKGMKVSLNTDDILLFGNDINDEYLLLYNLNKLSAEEINYIRKNGLYF